PDLVETLDPLQPLDQHRRVGAEVDEVGGVHDVAGAEALDGVEHGHPRGALAPEQLDDRGGQRGVAVAVALLAVDAHPPGPGQLGHRRHHAPASACPASHPAATAPRPTATLAAT